MAQSQVGIRSYGPGKFQTYLDMAVYLLSLDGCEAEKGEAAAGGWYGLITTDKRFVDDIATILRDKRFPITTEERDVLSNAAGMILSEDSQGSVHVEYFFSTRSLRRAWRDIPDPEPED